MHLFLRDDLVKGPTQPKKAKPASSPKVKEASGSSATKTTGEQRGGSYIARVQTGYDKDGSPKYRYFKSQDEYKSWKEKNGKGAKKKKNPHNLKQKVEREHKESTEKQGAAPQTKGSDPLKDNKKVSKGLYVRSA